MKKKILIVISLFLLAGISYFGYQGYKGKSEPKILSEKDIKQVQEQPQPTDEDSGSIEIEEADEVDEAALDAQYADFNSKCEAGTWVDIEAVSGEKKTFAGKFSVEVPFEEDGEILDTEDAKDLYFLSGDKQVVSSKDDILGFFEAREVEISGVENQGKIMPEKIRCAGKDTNKELLVFRQDVMNHVSKNFSSLAPEKGDWEVYDIAWPADDHIYVDYAAVESEDEETIDENVYSLLLQVSKESGQIKVAQLAYLKMSDSEEEDWDVISGTDKFKDMEDLDFYEYDEDLGKWVK